MAESPTAFNAAQQPTAAVLGAAGVIPGSAASAVPTGVDALATTITDDVVADLTAGLAVFTALQDTSGMACYSALLQEIQAIQKAVAAQGLPKVHVAYDLAVARALVLAVQPNSAIMNACSPIATQMATSVLSLVNGIVSGVAVKTVTAGVL